MSKSQRDKGKRGELEAGKCITTMLGGTCRRTPNSGGLAIKGDLHPNDNALEGWHIECKRQEKIALPKWMAQARSDAGARPWLLVHRRSNEPWHVTLEMDDLLVVLGELQELRAKELP